MIFLSYHSIMRIKGFENYDYTDGIVRNMESKTRTKPRVLMQYKNCFGEEYIRIYKDKRQFIVYLKDVELISNP
jgi:hypothetical protein